MTRGPGRPAELGEPRTRRVMLILHPDELDALRRAAGATPLAKWLRDTALASAADVGERP